MILGGALIGLIYCVKLGYDYHRLSEGLALAKKSYVADSLEKWREVQAILSKNLEIDKGHAASLAARALVEARIALAESEPIEQARALVSASSGGTPEGDVARGILAWMNGDEDSAWKFAHQAIENSDQGDFSPGCGQWLALWLSWQSNQVGAMGPAGIDLVHDFITREKVDAWIKEHEERPSYHRAVGRWLFRWGFHEQGLERVELARAKFPEHLGLTVDEAWMQVSLHRKASAVVELSHKLGSGQFAEGLSENDERILALANGAALLDLGQLDAAQQVFAEVWKELPDWDRVARRIQLEFVLRQAKPQWIHQWLSTNDDGAPYDKLDEEHLGLPESEIPWIDAWMSFARGDVAQSLVKLAKLDQQAPRTAYLQGLALVEQRRMTEAGPWLERSANLLPNQLETEIAQHRVASYFQLPILEEDKHRSMIKSSPYLFRAWSSLGEHILFQGLRADLDKDERKRREEKAVEAFEQAVLYEPWPAEARLHLTQLLPKPKLGRSMREEDYEVIRKIRTQFEAAVADCPKWPRYHQEFAEFLNEYGYVEEALEHLTIASKVENDMISPNIPLQLIQWHALQFSGYGYLQWPRKRVDAKLVDEMSVWLEQAAKLGAQANELAIARAFIAVTSTKKDALASSFEEINALSQQSMDDHMVIMLWVRLLVEIQGRESAEEVLSDRFRSLPRKHQARPRLWLATMKSGGGDPRQAARLAWGGWRMLLSQNSTANELLEAAEAVVSHWTAIRQKSGAYRAAREITQILGYHEKAWQLQATLEFAEDNPRAACESVQKALQLAPKDEKSLKLSKKCSKNG